MCAAFSKWVEQLWRHDPLNDYQIDVKSKKDIRRTGAKCRLRVFVRKLQNHPTTIQQSMVTDSETTTPTARALLLLNFK